MEQEKYYSLALIMKGRDILLGYKKKGVGHDKWHCFGGPVESDQNIEEATGRRIKEQCGLVVRKFEKAAILDFENKNDPVKTKVHVFVATEFEDTLEESRELLPQWFGPREIPFDSLWINIKNWLPKILYGKLLKGYMLFQGNEAVLYSKFNFVEIFNL
ncbi:7,8-dihydro-8-oxoguanine triphosphatase-like [Nilaparvata lugens]|uniref:7,8-dihydro-8-oxoguanine triphosphatase-like n=1 Tax=Nilaparvata lugens TaxID=108931 RepID=UPI00193CFB83|nr:7,8-dihydro-8-oxoguanine triphosphatase-like [Nilaparvata lugens]